MNLLKRPYLVHFMAIASQNSITIIASISRKKQQENNEIENLEHSPSSPLESLGLMKGRQFQVKLIAFDKQQKMIYQNIFETDLFGNLEIKIPSQINQDLISRLQVFEISTFPGIELLLGSYLPIRIQEPKKILISDFDKTLVHTRYSTAKELMESLRNPLSHYPPIKKSIKFIKEYAKDGFQPFILSASPHFYEKAMRDWLYQQQIFTAGIFLKDYRKVFSLSYGELTPKDIKIQGFYKLNHLVNILLMTGIPDELVLMGDGYETDTLIYLTLAYVLLDSRDIVTMKSVWNLWNQIKKDQIFRLSSKQNANFLNKFYQLADLKNKNRDKPSHLKILIRCGKGQSVPNCKLEFLNQNLNVVEAYQV